MLHRFGRALARSISSIALGAGIAAAQTPPESFVFDEAQWQSLAWRDVGPARGGRVAAVAGIPQDRETYYFGACGGGVWKTTAAGHRWRNVSDAYFGGSIGAVAVAAADPNVVYVGGGEKTVRGNVSHGDGLWKSMDAGKTWKHVGLADGRHIPRVRIHPKNPDLVYAAALGHLYGPNKERGVYRKMKVAAFLIYMARLKGLTAEDAGARVPRLLEDVGLPGIEGKRCEDLSKGMLQRVQFLAAIIHQPDLIILDEPFSGQDPVSVRLLRDHILKENRRGATVLLSTHVMSNAEEMCQHVVMIHQGRKVLDEAMAALNHAEMDEFMTLLRQLRDEGLTLIVVEHHMRAIMSLCERLVVLNFGQMIATGTPAEIARDPAVVEAYLGRSAA